MINTVNDNALKAAWQKEETTSAATKPPTPQEVLMDVKHRSNKLNRATLRRDVVETLATLLALSVFGFLALGTPGVVPKIGFVLAIPLIVAPIWRLLSERRRHRGLALDHTVAEQLAVEAKRVDGQIALLSSVDDWYIRPLTFAGMLILATVASAYPPGAGLGLRLVIAGIAAAFAWLLFQGVRVLVIKVNDRAVERELVPLRRDLEDALAGLNKS